MKDTTTGDHNTGVSWVSEDALCHATTGNGNTCVGNRAYQNGTGSSNVAIEALNIFSSISPNIPTGDGNVCIGYSGGIVNGSGHHNTTIGFSTKSADNINYSCAIGVGARSTKSNQNVGYNVGAGTHMTLINCTSINDISPKENSDNMTIKNGTIVS